MTTNDRLEYLRGEIRAERISYGEIAELADLADEIEPGDVELLEWAGVPEFPEDNDQNKEDQNMDVYIYTADPDEVDADKIRAALEELNYYVANVVVQQRP